MKENTIYIEKYKSELGDLKVSCIFKGETFALIGEERKWMIEAVRRTLAILNKYGLKCYDDNGQPKEEYIVGRDIPKTKFPIIEVGTK